MKNQIKNIYRSEPKETTRLEILSKRKNELKLSEFQTLYDYCNFCDNNSGCFMIANNPVENYKRVIKDWICYLTIIQLFPDELKSKKVDFYTDAYEEIRSLPKLTNNLEDDKIIFKNAVRNLFMNPSGKVRQYIMMYDIYFKNLF